MRVVVPTRHMLVLQTCYQQFQLGRVGATTCLAAAWSPLRPAVCQNLYVAEKKSRSLMLSHSAFHH